MPAITIRRKVALRISAKKNPDRIEKGVRGNAEKKTRCTLRNFEHKVEMDAKFLTDEELIAALKAHLKAQIRDGRIVSWTSNGTSVTKALMDRHELDLATNALSREARYRIGEGNEHLIAAFPRIEGRKRPGPERPGSFAS